MKNQPLGVLPPIQRLAWRIHLGAILPLLLLLGTGGILGGCTQPAAEPLGRPIERRQPVASPAAGDLPATPVPGPALAGLATVAQLDLLEPPTRDLRDLAARLNPALGEVPLTVAGPPRFYSLGDQEPFWVRNTSTNRAAEITASLVYSTPVAYVWVELGQNYDLDAIARSIDRFTAVTYPNVVNTFGSEWHPGVDNDPRLHILYNTQMGAGVVGYFSGADEYTRAASPFSNQKEMFYINLAALNGPGNLAYHDTTLAHEFQHMIHWHMDRGEDLWVNEGLSEYAQEVAEFGGDTMFVTGFAANPDLQLTTWGATGANNGPHYGSAYLFMAYLSQRLGREAITALVAAPPNGMRGVDAALQRVGAGIDAEQLFADWVVANYANQPNALGEDGRFGYVDLPLPTFAPAIRHEQVPVENQAAAVYNYATDYIELSGDGNLTFTFAGDTETRLAPVALAPGDRAWWSNRADDSESGLQRAYDLSALAPGTPLTLTAAMWWDIESDYDYGYVMASRDGEHWQILPGRHTAVDNPSGNAFGPGYTGTSGGGADGEPGDNSGWVDEQIDLSAYAGGPLWLRLSYITDDAVNLPGWLVDDMQLVGPDGPLAPLSTAANSAGATGEDATGEGVTGEEAAGEDAAGWQSTGWLLTDNRLPQRWLVQLLEFDGDTLTGVRRVPIDAEGRGQIDIAGLGGSLLSGGRRAVVAVSGLAPVTTLPANYTYSITQTIHSN